MSIALTSIAALAMLAGGAQESAPAMADGNGPQRVAPRGSFADSCSGSYVNQGRLYADCRDMRGNIRGTSIELARCSSSDIGNDNGLLVCANVRGDYEDRGGNNGGGGRPGGNGGGNGGGWGNGGNNGGGWGNGGNNGGGWGNGGNNGGGWGNGGNNGGGWGGNNGRSSITVYADSNYRGYSQTFRSEISNLNNSGLNDQISSMELNGPWEVCTDSNYRGQCQIVTNSIRNLNSTGYNDRISSMRPARGGGRW
ncbi:beta/gamma crystallin-related protein [Brevundimonas sp.]|uniref:beta/gamma crystallin-related protein n=1 Tax=Brevundimonas sp. TaxID=1871086 RepID=UPI002608F0CC|nr:beta/gamma crystallin-related protein [Brevundimonas sp.]